MTSKTYNRTRSFVDAINNLAGIVDETFTEYDEPIAKEVTALTQKLALVFKELFNIYPALDRDYEFQVKFIDELRRNYIKQLGLEDWQ